MSLNMLLEYISETSTKANKKTPIHTETNLQIILWNAKKDTNKIKNSFTA